MKVLRLRPLGISVVVLVCSLAASGTAQAGFKPFGASVPSNVAFGSTSDLSTVTFTITNNDSSQQLGSAQLALPTGFSLNAVVAVTTTNPKPKAPPTAYVVPTGCSSGLPSPCVEADNLYLSFHQSALITVSMTTPALCASPGVYTYPAPLAKQANSFNGTPGNPLNYTGGALTSTVGVCALYFDTSAFGVTPPGVEPGNALINTPISGTNYLAAGSPPLGAAVTVDAIDFRGQIAVSFGQVVAMALNNPPNGVGKLTYAAPVNAAAGVATFRDLTVDSPNDLYYLTASTTNDQVPTGTARVDSTDFTIANAESPCDANKSCSVPNTKNTNTNNSSSVTSNAQAGALAGNLILSYNTGSTSIDCSNPLYGGYQTVFPDVFVFAMDDNSGAINRTEVWTETLVTPVSPLPKSATGWASNPLVCFASDAQPFPVASGGTSTGMSASATLPDGRPGWLGLLPNCPSSGPCVDQKNVTKVKDRSSSLGFDVTVPMIVPPGWGDPYRN